MEKNELTQKKDGAKFSLLKSGLILSLMTAASRVMGLIRQMTTAAFLGTGMYADAYNVSFMIPNLLRRLFAENAISVAFIPTFKKYLEKEDTIENKKETQDFINATFTLVTFLTVIVVIIGILITPAIAPLFCKAPKDPSAANYAELLELYNLKKVEVTLLSRIMFPYLFLISVAAFFQGVLNGCKIFAPSGFTPVLFNAIVVISTYILAPKTKDPALAMSIGVILGGTVQALFQWPFIHKTGWKVCFTSLKKTIKNPGTRKVIALIAPTIIGIAAYQLNDVVCTYLANQIDVGVTSGLQYSLRLQELVLGIFAVTIGTVILPDLTGLANEKKNEEFNTLLIQAIKIMTVISIPVSFYSLVNGREIICLLYKGKAFDENSVNLTVSIFNYHIAGLLFIALNRIIAPAFYAQQNTKLPTLAGIYSFIANIILAVALAFPMRGQGIALALTLSTLINTIFLFIYMKKMDAMNTTKILKSTILYTIRVIIYSVIATVPIYFLRPVLLNAFADRGKILSYGMPVLISILIFAITGILELIITKDEIIMVVINKFRKRK
ncbi:MAG: murein biosynthesis integral membrane protein MurJ [Treponema sp.]|nr:murein biosynthesis integral membrane protein MurJ [Treponema sp.]